MDLRGFKGRKEGSLLPLLNLLAEIETKENDLKITVSTQYDVNMILHPAIRLIAYRLLATVTEIKN
jgi:hypothetical protein